MISQDVKITHLTDMSIVKSIITSKEIWEQAAEDGVSKEGYQPYFDSLTAWLLCECEGEQIGLIYIHNDSLCAVSIHPYLKHKHKRKGRAMMKAFFRWFISLPDTLCKVNVSIPASRKIVYNFSKKVGFKDEGINRSSFLKGGKVYDQYLLGLTRNEIKGLI